MLRKGQRREAALRAAQKDMNDTLVPANGGYISGSGRGMMMIRGGVIGCGNRYAVIFRCGQSIHGLFTHDAETGRQATDLAAGNVSRKGRECRGTDFFQQRSGEA